MKYSESAARGPESTRRTSWQHLSYLNNIQAPHLKIFSCPQTISKLPCFISESPEYPCSAQFSVSAIVSQ